MAIEIERIVEAATVEVTDDYTVAVRLTDPMTMVTVAVSFTLQQAADLADEILARKADAMSAYWEDRGKRPTPIRHGFDTDGPAAS